ncbi:MAG TPA: pesticidal protein Cry7Aa [Candidatus Paceibacterota bacterium]|nr:pesticidal protein Cry7Aa [Candidatus Paceibacterota bacterium]
MLKVEKHGVLLEPTEHIFERQAVLNPGVWQEGNNIHLFYRAIDEDHCSSVGYARLKGPTQVVERWQKPILAGEYPYESKGMEDPRMVKIGDILHMFYVAHDGKNALTAYATTEDLRHFVKKGIVSPTMSYHEFDLLNDELALKDAYSFFASYYEEGAGSDVLIWHKDVFPFPRKIKGRYALLHRILPDMQIAFFENFNQLQDNAYWWEQLKRLPEHVVLENKHWFETRSIGGGCPPVETKEGWLIIFHTTEERNKGRVYHACAALLDKDNPVKVLARLHEPLFSPTEEWEKQGFVSNVVFPTGTALFGDTLYIYYGAADKRIAVASVSVQELLKEMKDPTKDHNHAAL